MRKVFLEDLVRYKSGTTINWKQNVGKYIHFIYDDIEGDIKIVGYNKNYKISVQYKDCKVYEVNTSVIHNVNLEEILEYTSLRYKYKIGQRIKDNKRDITITDRKVIVKNIKTKNTKSGYTKCNVKYYKYNCNLCGFNGGKHWYTRENCYRDELWIEENALCCGGQGCSCCCTPSQIVVEGINDITTTANWLIPIINDLEFCKTHGKTTTEQIYPTCPICGEIKNKQLKVSTIYSNGSMFCSTCNDGIKYPNKFAFKMLEELGIEFISEYSPDWIKPKRYDFYILSMNLIIEMDGGLGHGNDSIDKTAEESKTIDEYKDEQARLHGIKVIRIDCDYDDMLYRFEYIKGNVVNKLKNIFNLNNINWNKINEYACSSLIKISSKYKRDNPKLSTTEIGKLMGGYNRNTISNWLKIGNKLKLCHYHSVQFLICFNNEKIYKTCEECANDINEYYNMNLNKRSIANSSSHNKSYKGFLFKYIDWLTDEEYIKYDIENKLKELNIERSDL